MVIGVSGREAVWDTLTSPKVTDEVARLSRLPGGGIIAKNYKDWMEQEFAQYMFQPQLQILINLLSILLQKRVLV